VAIDLVSIFVNTPGFKTSTRQRDSSVVDRLTMVTLTQHGSFDAHVAFVCNHDRN